MSSGVPVRDSPRGVAAFSQGTTTGVTAPPPPPGVPLRTGADSGSGPAEGATSTAEQRGVRRRTATGVTTGPARRPRGPMFTTGGENIFIIQGVPPLLVDLDWVDFDLGGDWDSLPTSQNLGRQ